MTKHSMLLRDHISPFDNKNRSGQFALNFSATGKAVVDLCQIATATGHMKILKTILSCFTGKWVKELIMVYSE